MRVVSSRRRYFSVVRTLECPRRRRRTSSGDRKSTRLNSSHVESSYAVFCLKKTRTSGFSGPSIPSSPARSFFLNDTASTEIYTLSLHDALPISRRRRTSSDSVLTAGSRFRPGTPAAIRAASTRSEEHTSELQSRRDLVCRLLLEKKKKKNYIQIIQYKKENEL